MAELSQSEADAIAAGFLSTEAKPETAEFIESDFVPDADLSGPHQPRGGATFSERINGTLWRFAPLDAGGYNRSLKATTEADKKRSKLTRDSVKLQARLGALENRFTAAAIAEAKGGEVTETCDEVEALIEAVETEIEANQQAQSALLLAPLEAMRAVVQSCLRDWVRADNIPFNERSVAALDSSRINELATVVMERYVAGQSNAQFRARAASR